MDNLNEKILIEAGLSEEQALVYFSLLEKGPMKAGPISSWTGIKRGLVYKVLEQLQNLGLVSKNENMGAVAVFSPSHPERLREIMEQKERAFSLAKETVILSLGSLSSKFNLLSGKPNVQFFEGQEAIKRITNDYPKEDKEIRQWIDISQAMKIIGSDTVGYLKERVKKGITKRMIVPFSVENENYVKTGSELTSFRFIDKNIPTGIQVYDNTLAMLTLSGDKNIGLIIEDKEIAETLKNIFDYNWQKAQEIN